MRGPELLLAAIAIFAVSGCNSVETTLASAADPNTGAVRPLTGAAAGVSTANVASVLKTSGFKVTIAPIIGAPVEAVSPLSKRLNARAREQGLTLVASGDKTATHTAKGYFSALSDNGKVTIIYVWDILDPAGNRLHRIQGQQQATGTAGSDAWKGVTPQTMESIGIMSMDQIAQWLAEQRTRRVS